MRGVLPDLADENRVRRTRFHLPIEGLRKGRRQFVDDVEAPAAGARRQPMSQHAVRISDHEVHIGRLSFLDVREGRHPPPAPIGVGIVREIVPSVVGRILRLIRAHVAVTPQPIEVTAVAPRVAEHPVDENADPHDPRRVAEVAKLLLRPEQRIDFFVISRVIAVIALRLKDGIEIERRNA